MGNNLEQVIVLCQRDSGDPPEFGGVALSSSLISLADFAERHVSLDGFWNRISLFNPEDKNRGYIFAFKKSQPIYDQSVHISEIPSYYLVKFTRNQIQQRVPNLDLMKESEEYDYIGPEASMTIIKTLGQIELDSGGLVRELAEDTVDSVFGNAPFKTVVDNYLDEIFYDSPGRKDMVLAYQHLLKAHISGDGHGVNYWNVMISDLLEFEDMRSY